MSNTLFANHDAIRAFLATYAEAWTLVAIEPGSSIVAKSFTSAATAANWAEAQNNQGRNIYFHVNPIKGPITKKAKKEDIAAIAYLHVDIDPQPGEDLAEERARISALLGGNLPAGVSISIELGPRIGVQEGPLYVV